MFFRTSKRKKWQKKYINEVFNKGSNQGEDYYSLILSNIELLNAKEKHLPKRLFKFYAPTSDNILDINDRKLWLAHPSCFNDPFDCQIGYNRVEYEKYCLLKIMTKESKELGNFTLDEIERIRNSSTKFILYSFYNRREDYHDVSRKVLQSKPDDIRSKVFNLLMREMASLDLKLEKLRKNNIRVACFAGFDDFEEINKKIQMWSHYADNHKGFCAEYDISSLQEETVLNLDKYQFYKQKETYLDERLKASIKGGLFPIIYTSERVNLPVTRLHRLKLNDLDELGKRCKMDGLIYKTFIVKASCWSYEKEWRIILNGKICSYYDNRIPFPYISKLYLGCKMEDNIKDRLLEIGDKLGIKVEIMKMDSNKFLIEESYYNSYKWDKEWGKRNNPFED